MNKIQQKDMDKVLKLAVIGCQDMQRLATMVMSDASLQDHTSVGNARGIVRLAVALPLLTEAQAVSATKRNFHDYSSRALPLIQALHQYGQKYLGYPKSKAAKK